MPESEFTCWNSLKYISRLVYKVPTSSPSYSLNDLPWGFFDTKFSKTFLSSSRRVKLQW